MTASSVTGMANHSESAPVTTGRSMMIMPLITRPRDTYTMNAARGFIIA